MLNMAVLEGHYRDLCDIEFTVERGKLWMLQTRVGKRTPGASFKIAAQFVAEGLINLDEALLASVRCPTCAGCSSRRSTTTPSGEPIDARHSGVPRCSSWSRSF